MSEQIDWERLARYVSGEASESEIADIDRWAATDPEHKRLLASVERRWRAAAQTPSFNVDAAWQRMAPKLKGGERSNIVALPPRESVIRPWMFAAAAALVMAVAMSSRLIQPRSEENAGTLGALAAMDVRTAVGERRTVELPDGSKAVLGVNSTLKFEPSAAGAARVVRLDGEAYFTVVHDPARPFRVAAGNIVTQDVGTEFSIRAYPGEGRVRVAVQEGAVSLIGPGASSADQGVLLGQLDVAVVGADGSPKVTSDSAVARFFAWRDGNLVFDNASLAEVAIELSRWYDVELRFANAELASRHLTSTFKSDPIDDVLRVIGLSAEVRFERHGRVVTVYPAPRTSNGDAIGPRGSNVAERVED